MAAAGHAGPRGTAANFPGLLFPGLKGGANLFD